MYTPAMNELKEVTNPSTFFWFWQEILYYGYGPHYDLYVCTPLSNRTASDIDGEQKRFAALYKDTGVYWHSVDSWIYGTPYSPGESATYYIDNSGDSSPRSTSLLEIRGVTPQGKIHPDAKAVNIYISYNGLSFIQNPRELYGVLLQLEKKNIIIRIITSFLMVPVFLEVLDGYMLVTKEVSITPQYKGEHHSSSWWHRMAALHSSGDEWWIWLSSASYGIVRS